MASNAKPQLNNLDLDALSAIGKSRRRTAVTSAKQGSGVVQDKLDKHIEKIKSRTALSLIKQDTEVESRHLQAVLPFWDDECRGVPNPFIRSGLFSVKNTVAREFVQNMQIASLSNYNVAYSGIELRQCDLSVWLSLINLARNQSMSDAVLFTGYALVKDLGWRMHSESYRKVQESIARLKVTGIEISTNNSESAYSGSLIRDYAWTARDEKGNARWMVRFEPRVSTLFLDDTTTLFEWETRKRIGTRATLAQWLHSFYSSHREPIPLTVAKLFELCRSGDSVSSFRRNVKNALAKLVEVDFLLSFHVIDDTVHVKKKVRPRLIRAK